MESWVEKEIENSTFPDARLKTRFRALLEQLSNAIGKPIPFACQDWANTKAAYRFFSNERFSEAEILEGHFQSTKDRFDKLKQNVLVLHDTTEFTFKREKESEIGFTTKIPTKKNKKGRPTMKTLCGLLMHSSLVVTEEGLPLGLIANKFWTRKKFKGANQLKKKINPTRVPIEEKESIRWLENLKQATETLGKPEQITHIGDRESDIYELFCAAQESKSHFLFRICADRLVENGDEEIRMSELMEEVKVKGKHKIEVRDKKVKFSTAVLELKYKKVKVFPPKDKRKKYPEMELTLIHAEEIEKPEGRERISWKLLTDLEIKSKRDVLEKLEWYALRWRVEDFFKIVKSGCKAEELKMREAERLTKIISVFCIISWRIFWMTMLRRVSPKGKASLAFTETEIKLLKELFPQKKKGTKNEEISDYVLQVAKLGGYLARNSDPPPGNLVMWRGFSRLMDIQFGFSICNKNCG